MLAKRIIPCLDVKDGQVVKGIGFKGLREVGDPVEMGAFYSAQGADELVYLDISASSEGRKTFTGLVSRIAERIDIPFTVGGGISSFEDAARLLDAGADKITVNTAAVFHPEIISKIASRYGSQFVVVAIDARTVASGMAAEPVEATSLYGNAYWQVMTHGGKRPTDKELYSWSKQVQNLGTGEILFTSMDNDGTKNGYAVQAYSHLNAEALEKTQTSGLVTFFSRSRQTLWTKGETSGNYLHLVSISADCDSDTLLVRAIPDGPVCHKGTKTCWGDAVPASTGFIRELESVIKGRHERMPEKSYTTSLFKAGTPRMAQKVGEEAVETVIEAVKGDDERMIYEASDLVYHLLVLLVSKGYGITDLEKELERRHK